MGERFGGLSQNRIVTYHMKELIMDRAQDWLKSPYDEETIALVRELMESDPKELEESFYKDLEFGTGGLRGIMGVGPNRMNRYSVGLATQGFANYLRLQFGEGKHSIAIAHDCRNNSRFFAEETAKVFSGNGFQVYLFGELRPTPELSFAIRELGCKAGVVITASHNPPEYNGYKVYWEDGAQVISPHDKAIIDEVRKLDGPKAISRDEELNVSVLGRDMDERFLSKVESNAILPEVIQSQSDFGIVYTSLHGTGATLIPEALKRIGFQNVHSVPEQHAPDGNFSTVESPNPEEGEALSMAIEQAKARGASLVLGTDPDTDRVGIAVDSGNGNFVLLNGNDTGVLLTWYQLTQLKTVGKLPENGYIAKTVVTSPLFDKIASDLNVPCYNTLTGFKYIAGVIREHEAEETFITGAEESYGYMIGDFVRDKDGVSAATMICEMAAWCASQGMTLLDLLKKIHEEHGFYKEALVSLKKSGISGSEEIQAMMKGFRSDTPKEINGSAVLEVRDFLYSECIFLKEDRKESIDQPKSNVIQFLLEDGSLVTARPSGTEPKIKFYFSVNDTSTDDYETRSQRLSARIEALKQSFLN